MKNFKKYYTLNASPEDIYNVLTNPLMIEIWTGEPVVMSTEPGSDFSMWDGVISGKNIEFEENKLIVQEWDFGDEKSTVTIKLHPSGTGTSVEVRQVNIPDEAYVNIVSGWDEEYFGNLNQLFEE
jgi:activator of HSP90 ATPase